MKVYDFDVFYKKWSLLHSVVMVIALAIALVSQYSFFLYAGLMSLGHYLFRLRDFLPRYPMVLGYGNLITLLRLMLIFLALGIADEAGNLMLMAIFLSAILLDGVDGYVARKWKESGKPGECFDMETDAFMVLVMSLLHFERGAVEWWVLIPGGMRYFFQLLFFRIKGDYPPKKMRATIAVIFFFALLAPFVLPETISHWFLVISSILIALSFGSTIWTAAENSIAIAAKSHK